VPGVDGITVETIKMAGDALYSVISHFTESYFGLDVFQMDVM